jgi:hypothetical protein
MAGDGVRFQYGGLLQRAWPHILPLEHGGSGCVNFRRQPSPAANPATQAGTRHNAVWKQITDEADNILRNPPVSLIPADPILIAAKMPMRDRAQINGGLVPIVTYLERT